MGAIGGGIWHGIKGARNSPKVRAFTFVHFEHAMNSACASGRTIRRCRLHHQSPGTRHRWQLRCLGWYVLNIRLCGEGLATEGGCVECDHLWIHDRWLFGSTKSVDVRSDLTFVILLNACLLLRRWDTQVGHDQRWDQQWLVVSCWVCSRAWASFLDGYSRRTPDHSFLLVRPQSSYFACTA